MLCYVMTHDTWAHACTYFSLTLYPVLFLCVSCLYLFQSNMKSLRESHDWRRQVVT